MVAIVPGTVAVVAEAAVVAAVVAVAVASAPARVGQLLEVSHRGHHGANLHGHRLLRRLDLGAYVGLRLELFIHALQLADLPNPALKTPPC